MAKVTNPFYSVSASGAFSRSVIFQRQPVGGVAKNYVGPHNPDSELQSAHRARIAAACATFHQVGYSLADLRAFVLAARMVGRSLSGYQFYMCLVMSLLRRFIAPNLCSGFVVDVDTAGYIVFSVEYYGAGDCFFQYGNAPHNLGQLVAMTPPGAGTTWVGEISGLTPGERVYIRFSNSNIDSDIVSGIYEYKCTGSVGPIDIPVHLTLDDMRNQGSYIDCSFFPDYELDYAMLSSVDGGPFIEPYFFVHYPPLRYYFKVSAPFGPPWKIRVTALTPGYEVIGNDFTIPWVG